MTKWTPQQWREHQAWLDAWVAADHPAMSAFKNMSKKTRYRLAREAWVQMRRQQKADERAALKMEDVI